LQVVSSTIAGNRAGIAGANIHQGSVANTSLSLRNSIVSGGVIDAAGVASSDIDIFQPGGAVVTSLGYNIITNRSAGTGYAATDAPNGTNPVLGALAANGGPTQTLLPLAMSPATGFVPLVSCLDETGAALTRDQRGVPRRAAGATTCDAGATEASRLSITTTLPNAVLSTAYSQTLNAAGGLAPFTFSLSSGALPAGLTLAGAVISGTPTSVGSSTFTIGVVDQTGATTTRAYTISVQSAPTIATLTLPNGTVGAAYSTTIVATGSPAPTFSGAGLPPGLTLTPAGLLSGTPTTAGTFSSVTVTASNGVGSDASRTYTIVIAPATFTLTVNLTGTSGGNVSGSGLTCVGSTCTGTYNEGTAVTLSAKANALQYFSGWNGGGCSGIVGCVVTLNANTTVSAIFAATPPLPTAKRNDFNADGKSDIANTDASGSTNLLLMNGVAPGAPVNLLAAGSGWTITHIADFNGDNNADIALKNADGRIGLLLMNGTSVLSYTELYPSGTLWSVLKTADLNGDGKADLIIQNTNGSAAIHTMNGATITSTSLLLAPGSPYSVSNTGDFNGDGKADIIVKQADGTAAILLMDGGTILAASLLLSAGPWTVTDVADFDGDRKADVVIKRADGTVAILLMNSLTVTGAQFVLLAGSPWSVTHTGDFDGDGKADIVVTNTDGSVVLLQMNGTAVSSASFLLLAGSTSTVVQVADYNGDGKSDVLLRNADGSATAVLMNGNVVTAFGSVWGPGSQQIVP
jgi:FG-GAP-like repeat/Putative Ig domain